MLGPIDEPRFTFTEAALAAGVSGKTLRNWLDREQIHLDAEAGRQAEGWRRFSILDAIRIAFVARLVEFGSPVKIASKMTENSIVKFIFKTFSGAKGDDIISMMPEMLRQFVFIYYERNGENFSKKQLGSEIDLREEISCGVNSFRIIGAGVLDSLWDNLGIEKFQRKQTS